MIRITLLETAMQLVERDRNETIEKLRQLKGVNLWALASYYNVLFNGPEGKERPSLKYRYPGFQREQVKRKAIYAVGRVLG